MFGIPSPSTGSDATVEATTTTGPAGVAVTEGHEVLVSVVSGRSSSSMDWSITLRKEGGNVV